MPCCMHPPASQICVRVNCPAKHVIGSRTAQKTLVSPHRSETRGDAIVPGGVMHRDLHGGWLKMQRRCVFCQSVLLARSARGRREIERRARPHLHLQLTRACRTCSTAYMFIYREMGDVNVVHRWGCGIGAQPQHGMARY